MNIPLDYIKGEIILIDKPLNWTSFDVVNKLRHALCKSLKVKKLKVGHAGTLDPLATGLLIICTGKKTKEIDNYQGMPKEYTGTFTLGKTTPSIDLETDFNKEYDTSHITNDLIEKTLHSFRGDIQQIPPIYSAIKVNGTRVYEHARNGEIVEIEPRTVSIHQLDTESTNFPDIDFKVNCSKGTYIRSLVRDIGESLDSGAFLANLRRTKIGDFDVDHAQSVDSFLNSLQK